MNAAMARGDAEVGRWIHGLSVNQHFEIQMRPIGDTGITHDAEFLPSHDRRLTCGKYWTDHSEMAVDADIAIVLHQHLETTGTLVLNADQRAGFGGKYRRTVRHRQIDTVVIGARLRPVRQNARAERRRDAG